MNYKRLIPCIFIYQGKAVKWFDNLEILSDDVVKLAKKLRMSQNVSGKKR